MKKKIISLLLCAVMTVSLTACGGNGAQTSSDGAQETAAPVAEESDGELGLAEQESDASINDIANADNSAEREGINVGWREATSLEPWGTNNDIPGNYEVYEMLYECDAKGNRYPILADESRGEFGGYDHEEGSAVYDVYIYDYIKDHEGNPITASDVAFSYTWQFNNATASGWGAFQMAEAVDDTTVRFTFEKELTDLGALDNFLCRCFIVSEAACGGDGSALASKMCGTGPYKFDSYVSGSSLTIVKNDDYWQTDESLRHQEQQANVRTITYKFIAEGSQRQNGLTTGELDMVYDMQRENIAPFLDGGDQADKFNVQTYAQKFVYYLNCNCDPDMPTGDENLRKAIYYAIDQDGLITAMGGTDSYTRAYAYVSDYYSDYDMVDWASLDNYNTKKSVDMNVVQEYLNASSYNGEKLVLMLPSDYSTVGTVIAAQLEAAGIHAELKQVDNATFNSTLTDKSAWDIVFNMMAGDYNVQVWAHDYSWANTGDGDHTQEFITDQEWEDLLNLCNTEEGHTSENMKAWWEMATQHAYGMGLYTGNSYNIVPEECTYVCQGDKLVLLPGACTFNAE